MTVISEAKPRWKLDTWLYRLLVVVIYVLAAVLVLVPAFFLYLGIDELGGDLGWWTGEPTSNDGPGIGLVMGGLPIILIVGLAAAAVLALARRAGRSGWPAALLGSIWLLLLVGVLIVWVLTDSISRLTTP